MAKVKDISGQRFNCFMAIRRSGRTDYVGRAFWYVRCDCGQYLEVRGDNLRSGSSKQCSDCSNYGRQSNFVDKGVVYADI